MPTTIIASRMKNAMAALSAMVSRWSRTFWGILGLSAMLGRTNANKISTPMSESAVMSAADMGMARRA